MKNVTFCYSYHESKTSFLKYVTFDKITLYERVVNRETKKNNKHKDAGL